MEMQDTYVRLDNSIAELLELIDRKVGLNNTLFFITSTGYADADPVDSPQYKIPGGEFHIERCSALLNLYWQLFTVKDNGWRRILSSKYT